MAIKKRYFFMFKEGIDPFIKLRSACAKHFLLWIVFNGWGFEDGMFYFGATEHKKFSQYMETLGYRPYARNTLDVALKELRYQKLVIRGTARGMYYINPEFIWVGPTSERLKAIKKIKELEKIKEETVA